MHKLILCLLSISLPSFAQQKDNIDTALIPFWKTKIMHNESVMMIAKKGELPVSTLLFKPEKILSVRNAALNMTYKEGTDWIYKNGKLILPAGSRAVFMPEEKLYYDSSERRFPKKGGGFILYREGSFFHEHQLAVTYKHAKNAWKGPVPQFQGHQLPLSYHKLKNKTSLKVLLFGDSIAAGANASGVNNAAPYLPGFGALLVEGWRRFFNAPLEFVNPSVGGMDSNWGKNTTPENVIAHHPDLVIIAFGMNDGTGQLPADKFKANISAIITQTRKVYPATEFILVATTMPNPRSHFTGTQAAFKTVLEELTGPGIILTDMTAVHNTLMQTKSFEDMTGNDINHPNDFLIRWYAQQIAGVFYR